MALVSLLVGVYFKDVHFVGVFLVLHREQTYHSGLCSHGNCTDFLGEAHVLFKAFGIDFYLSQTDYPLSVFPHRNISAEKTGGIVRKDVLGVKTMRGKT